MNGAAQPFGSSGVVGDSPVWLRHNRIDLALHRLRGSVHRKAHPLLLLHGLGERISGSSAERLEWPGDVYGLDFTGHGLSTVPTGGGYTSEVLAADVDVALDHLGPVTIVGRGLGAYVALLIAAARPTTVRGAILADGPGIAGGGVQPGSPSLTFPPPWADTPPDPFAMAELSRDVRPPDYALNLLRLATDRNDLETVFVVTAVARPEWLEALVSQPGVDNGDLDQALKLFASQVT